MKTRISYILELLTRQIATQEKQFLELTQTVKDLVREKSQLQNALAEQQGETDALKSESQRTRELLEAKRLERWKDDARKVHQACQTVDIEITS